MEYKRFGHEIALRVARGEELIESLRSVCEKENIRLATVSGLGAAGVVEMGLYNVENKEYHSHTFTGEFEIAQVTGNVTTMDGEVYIHLHATIGDEKLRAWAGHLNKAVISATAELFIHILEGETNRTRNDETGLNLLHFLD